MDFAFSHGHSNTNLLLTNASMAYQTALNMQPSNTKYFSVSQMTLE